MAVRKPVAHLLRVDPAFHGIVASAPDFAVHGRQQGDYFNALVRAIVYQQLAGKAAAAILATPEEALRAAGLSNAKTLAIRDLALKSTDGTVPLERIEKLPDDEIVARLSAVRGIGRWTAEMFLIFQLGRQDVWPVDDLGVRRGYAEIHHLSQWPKPKELQALGEIYRPYRTAAAWYCWRTADIIDF